MELFVINRYVGEDYPCKQAPNESELRKELIEKALKRKKLAESNAVNSGGEKDKTDESKAKIKLVDANVIGDKREFETDNLKLKKKKKKRKKNELGDKSFDNVPVKETKVKRKKSDIENENVNISPDTETAATEGGEDASENVTESKAFSVLGVDSFTKPTKVKRTIPYWLANPSIVSVDLKKLDAPIDSIPELDEIFIKKLRENNITHFFPVQMQIIPWLLEIIKKPTFYWPNDICVSAPTGSGKTLAFVLPILQALHKRIVPEVRAIVVLPVQDLAVQVYKVFETYNQPTDLKVLLLSKNRPFSVEQNLIRKKDELTGVTTLIDIIVTTPGRLVDHLMDTDGLSLKYLKYLVIDEADRVMDDMQNDWLYHLNKKILVDSSKSYQAPVLTLNTLAGRKKLPQKLLFSATLSQDPEKLQQLGLFQPKLFTSVVASNANEGKFSNSMTVSRFIGKYTTPAELQEYYALSTKATKPLIIHHLLTESSWKSILCFVNSIEATTRLSFVLKKMNSDLKIANISAKLNPLRRDNLIKSFANGKIDMLISSDALARGIDIPNVKYVISYSLPKYLKTYIHRIGRTGRAGKSGASLILLTKSEVEHFREMTEDAGKMAVQEMTIEESCLEEYTEAYEKALGKLKTRLQKNKEITLKKIKSMKFKNKIKRKGNARV